MGLGVRRVSLTRRWGWFKLIALCSLLALGGALAERSMVRGRRCWEKRLDFVYRKDCTCGIAPAGKGRSQQHILSGYPLCIISASAKYSRTSRAKLPLPASGIRNSSSSIISGRRRILCGRKTAENKPSNSRRPGTSTDSIRSRYCCCCSLSELALSGRYPPCVLCGYVAILDYTPAAIYHSIYQVLYCFS